MPHVIASIVADLESTGVDIPRLGLAWARTMPLVAIIPAFGLRALPGPARAWTGLAFAATILPAIAPATSDGTMPYGVELTLEFARGLPIAIAAAVPLWAATMAGGVADVLRGAAQETAGLPTVEGRSTTLGTPLSLLACTMFLATGGPARVARALTDDPQRSLSVLSVAECLVSGITLAVALGAPLLAASVIVELAAALVARAAAPAQVHTLLAPLRAVATLAIFAIVLERLAGVLARAVH